jgi:hypothetical protein
MKYTRKLRHLLILGCFLICPLVSRADDHTEDMRSFDIGIANKVNGSVHGFELGAVNEVEKDFGGGQFGFFNVVKREFNGFQFGLIANRTGHSFEGFQAAVFYNDTQEELRGLQLGIVNHAGSLNGIQIGILNFNDDNKYLGFLPFINAAF